MSAKKMTLREAAVTILQECGPMHYEQLTQEILSRGLAASDSKTPAASLNAMIAVDLKRKGKQSPFQRIRPGVFSLRDATVEQVDDEQPALPDEDRRVRIPLFPLHSEVRQLLQVWPGFAWKKITGFRATIAQLRGTPQENADWTDPDAWIPERLKGSDLELASAIWQQSGRTVNPRHTYGAWLLAQKYDLIRESPTGIVELTRHGQGFLNREDGVEAHVDEQEGLVHLLALVAQSGPVRPGGLLEEWTDYLNRRSTFGSPSTCKDTMRRRLVNLLARDLVARKGGLYSATDQGLAYLEEVGHDESLGSDEGQELWALVRQQEASVRESLRELLLDLDWLAFEHLVKRLLEEMDYTNVQVTSPSGDGGVDVVADIELGITSVREVVQAKRHKRAIQRKDLDALRGSLYRFNAVRGTIITTSRFAKGTLDAAFAQGAPPITLIDGEKLVDLLIRYGIGVRKRPVEILELDPDALSEVEGEG